MITEKDLIDALAEGTDPGPPPEAVVARIDLVRKALARCPEAVASPVPQVIVDGPAKAEVLRLTGEMVIGSEEACDLVVACRFVSGEHCRLLPDVDRWVVEDLGSTNGTRVNGTKIRRACLRDGDVISVGKARLIYLAGLAEPE